MCRISRVPSNNASHKVSKASHKLLVVSGCFTSSLPNSPPSCSSWFLVLFWLGLSWDQCCGGCQERPRNRLRMPQQSLMRLLATSELFVLLQWRIRKPGIKVSFIQFILDFGKAILQLSVLGPREKISNASLWLGVYSSTVFLHVLRCKKG